MLAIVSSMGADTASACCRLGFRSQVRAGGIPSLGDDDVVEGKIALAEASETDLDHHSCEIERPVWSWERCRTDSTLAIRVERRSRDNFEWAMPERLNQSA